MAYDPLALLAEWFRWWLNSEEVPVKMPDALHVRTGMLLTTRGRINPDEGLEPKGIDDAEILDSLLDAIIAVSLRLKDTQLTLIDVPSNELPTIIDTFGPVDVAGPDDPIETHDEDCILNWPHDGPCVHEDDGDG